VLQQAAPQQNAPPMQVIPILHGGAMHVPLLQYGCAVMPEEHCLPQMPQLLMSFTRSTHWPLQHVLPGLHIIGHDPPLELELELPPMQHARQVES
jgi:hypothetical protein